VTSARLTLPDWDASPAFVLGLADQPAAQPRDLAQQRVADPPAPPVATKFRNFWGNEEQATGAHGRVSALLRYNSA
jgi:hypothetical protein